MVYCLSLASCAHAVLKNATAGPAETLELNGFCCWNLPFLSIKITLCSKISQPCAVLDWFRHVSTVLRKSFKGESKPVMRIC